MAKSAVKDFLLRLGVKDDASGPLGTVARAMGHVERQGPRMASAGKRFQTGLARIAAVGGAAAAGLGLLLRHTIEAGDALGEQAQRSGMTVNGYAALAHSAAQADVSQESFTAAIDKFNASLGQARAGTGDMLSFLQRVSPVLARQVVGVKDTESAVVLLSGAFAKIEDPAKRAALASAIFGRGQQQMGVWLSQGKDAILDQAAAYMQAAGDQEKAAEAAGRLDNALRDARVPVERLARVVLVALAPSIERLAGRMGPLVDRIAPKFELWAGRLATWLEGPGPGRFADQLGRAVDWLGRFAEAIGPVGVAVLATIPLWAPMAAGMGTLAVSAGSLAMALGPVTIPLLAIGAASVAIASDLGALDAAVKDLWVDIKWAFTDGMAWIEHVVAKAGGLVGVLLNPTSALLPAATESDWTIRANGGQGGKATGASPSLATSALQWAANAGTYSTMGVVSGVASAAKGAQAGATEILVKFTGAPRGTQVSTDGSADVTTDVGYTLGGDW